MARNVYGLDLGTYEIKVFDKKKDSIWREKNVIAMKDKKYIFSVGDEAYEMYEKSPDNIQVSSFFKKSSFLCLVDMPASISFFISNIIEINSKPVSS